MYADIVDAEAAGWTCLQFYARRYPHSTCQVWKGRLAAGQIRRRDETLCAESLLAVNDRLQYYREPWAEPPAPCWFAVLHEVDHVLAVAKPAGLQVLPAASFLQNTLLYLVRQKRGDDWAPAHRLGRGTTGLVLFVRSTAVRKGVAAAFREGGLRKIYRGLAQGTDLPDQFEVKTNIGAVPDPIMGRLHVAVASGGRPSQSLVRVIERRPSSNTTLVEVEIPTGRPHQIRIHMAAAGHPLVGDPLYEVGGRPGPGRKAGTDGSAMVRPGDVGYHLHAMSVEFIHPVTERQVSIYCQPPSILRAAAESG